jgi:hypothetical protein
MNARQGRKRGLGKVVGIKPTEEVRGDLGLQFSHMESRVFGIKRLSVDKFERPGPYIEEDILTLQEGPAFSDTTESDMGKRTPHICVHLNDSHALSICRQIIWAFLSLPDVGVTKLRGARRTNVEVDASSWVKVLSAMKRGIHGEIRFVQTSGPWGNVLGTRPRIKPGRATGFSRWISFSTFARTEEGNPRLL